MENDYNLQDLLYLMARLRDEKDGCPWDRQQDFSSIAPYTIEESYELADAIASGDFTHIKEEVGDVLFQVVFYAQLGSEQGRFSFGDIVSSLVTKLVNRHPHVFPAGTLSSRANKSPDNTQVVSQKWEQIKAEERADRQQTSAMDNIPSNLPALARAVKLQNRAARDGFDWQDSAGVIRKLQEELSELELACQDGRQQAIEEELGDVLFTYVNFARHLKINPEMALRGANRKFEQRYRFIEQELESKGMTPSTASMEDMEHLWQKAKAAGL